MAVTQQEQTKPCEISLDIEVEPDEVSKAFVEAYHELGRQTEVPGFRKGKAPTAILKQVLPEERVKERAAERLVQAAYDSALEETGIEPFGKAEYEVVHLEEAEPFRFKARVPLSPKVELGQYVGVEVERLVPVVSDEDVQREMDEIRERAAAVETVEGRPVQKGDLVIASVTSPAGETRETVLEAGSNLDSFDEGLIGMSKGEARTIEVVYPDDYGEKDLAGTTANITVAVSDIKSRRIPEMTDELVREISERGEEKLESVEELKKRIRSAMEKAAFDLADRQAKSKIVEKIVEKSKVNFPDTLPEREVLRRFEDLLEELHSRKMDLDEYLKLSGRTFEELSSRFERAAERDIRANLVLYEIARRENIEVSDEDIQAEIARIAEESGVAKESMHAYLDKTGGRRSLENRLLYGKVLDFLLQASNIKNVGREAS